MSMKDWKTKLGAILAAIFATLAQMDPTRSAIWTAAATLAGGLLAYGVGDKMQKGTDAVREQTAAIAASAGQPMPAVPPAPPELVSVQVPANKLAQVRNILGGGAQVLFPILLVLALSGCAVIAPPPEDITAVKTVATRLPELLENNEAVYRTAIEQFSKELHNRAYSEAKQAADYELLAAGAVKDTDDHALPIRFESGGVVRIQATVEQVESILNEKARQEHEADAAIKKLYDAAMNHEVHGDLKLLVGLLHDYVLIRATDDEQRTLIASQAHDLVFKKKEK